MNDDEYADRGDDARGTARRNTSLIMLGSASLVMVGMVAFFAPAHLDAALAGLAGVLNVIPVFIKGSRR
jgi:hypothetical protein